MKQKKIIIIGSGIGGLASACLLGKAGFDVDIFEKNKEIGGRVGVLEKKGYRFDRGPSKYVASEIFHAFFTILEESFSRHVKLIKLDPQCRIYTSQSLNDPLDIYSRLEGKNNAKMIQYLERSFFLYKIPFSSFSLNYVKQYFTRRTSLEFAVYYPQGGMYSLVQALTKIAKKYGVFIHTNVPITHIRTSDNAVTGVTAADGAQYDADILISDAGYYHTEQELLQPEDRSYSARYWSSRTIAPSALIMYLGVRESVENLMHHTLLLPQDRHTSNRELYAQKPAFPRDPFCSICAPSKTDPTVAPKGKEQLVITVPVPAGLTYTGRQLASFKQRVLKHIEVTCRIPHF